jgi:hypothetical protein
VNALIPKAFGETFMAAKQTESDNRLTAKAVYYFAGGAAIGLFMISVPYWFSSIEMTPLHVGVAAGLVFLCGLLASIFGARFIEALAQALTSSGL